MMKIIGRMMGISLGRSINFCKVSWVSGAGKASRVEGSLSASDNKEKTQTKLL